jgi:hypothetical protein
VDKPLELSQAGVGENNMAIVIDPAAGALSQAIGDLGGGVGQYVFRKRIRERELQEDLAALQALVPSFQAARSGGPEAISGFEEMLGIRAGQAEVMFGPLVETPDQETARLSRNVGLPQLIVDNAFSQATLSGQELGEGLRVGLGVLRAVGQNQELEAQIAQNAVEGSYFTMFLEEGGPRIQLSADLAEHGNRLRRAGLNDEQIDRYRDIVNNIDQSTPFGQTIARMMAFAPTDPTTASFIGQAFLQSDANAFRAALAEFEANPTEMETAEFTARIMNSIRETVDTIDNLKNPSPDVLRVWRGMLDAQVNEAQRLMDLELVPGFNLPRAVAGRNFWGNLDDDKLEFVTQLTSLQSVADVVGAVREGVVSVEEIEKVKSTYFSTNEELNQWNAFVSFHETARQEEEAAQADQSLKYDSPENMQKMRDRLIELSSDSSMDPVRRRNETALILDTFNRIEQTQELSRFTHRMQSRYGHLPRER